MAKKKSKLSRYFLGEDKPLKVSPLSLEPNADIKSVAIIAMGESRKGFLNRIGTLERTALPDQIWACNASAILMDQAWIDQIWIMDDLKQQEEKANGFGRPDYKECLLRKNKPIITSTVYADWPNTVAYPVKEVLTKLGTMCLPNTNTCWALMYAIFLRIPEIQLWGTDFTFPNLPPEILTQVKQVGGELVVEGHSRVVFWCAMAMAMGISIVLPQESDLLGRVDFHKNRTLYGYFNPDFDAFALVKEVDEIRSKTNGSK